MRTIKRIFDFYIFSNIHVAFAVFCLAKITLLNFSIEDNLLPWFVFFSTIVSYNFIRLSKVLEIQPEAFHFIKLNIKGILWLTATSLFLTIYFAFSLKLKTLLALVPFFLFTLFYVVPIPINKNKETVLRSVALLKLFLIAISWAGVTVLVPLINYNVSIQYNEVIIFIQRFFFIVVITLPFDIRDLSFDNASLKTLPQVLGIQKSKVFGLFFLMLFLGLEFIKDTMTSETLQLHFLVAMISLFFLFKATENQNKYYSAFFVEGIPIVWLLLFLVFK